MSGRALKVGGVLAAAAAGYYLYNAGGDPKVAQKKAEADASQLSSTVKSEVSGKGSELQTKEEELRKIANKSLDKAVATANQSLDKAVASAKTLISDSEKKALEYQQKAGQELTKAVDKFDKEVAEKSAQAKSSISNWFGGSK